MGTIQELRCQNCFAPLDVAGSSRGIVKCGYCGTDNAMPSDVRKIQADDSHAFALALLRAMVNQTSMTDIKTICLTLSARTRSLVDFDNLSGSGKADKVRELILFSQRNKMLQELVDSILDTIPRFEIVM